MFTRHKAISFIIVLLFSMNGIRSMGSARSQKMPANQSKDWNKAALWSFIPGGGHFYLGEYKTGSVYLFGEVGLYLAGRQIEDKLEKGEQNIFYLHALKLHELGVFTAYRNARLKYSNDSYNIPIDDTPISTLTLAPFKWENIKSPPVYGSFLAGILLNLIEVSLNKEKRSFKDVAVVQIMGERFDRDSSLTAYASLWFPICLNVAVSEECLWKGMIQTQLEEVLGKKKGLIASSLLFGIGHVSKPTEIESWINGAVASLYGFYLGRLYQKDNYRLERAIAAHFWFNVGAGITLFLLDPENNPLGLKITFTF